MEKMDGAVRGLGGDFFEWWRGHWRGFGVDLLRAFSIVGTNVFARMFSRQFSRHVSRHFAQPRS